MDKSLAKSLANSVGRDMADIAGNFVELGIDALSEDGLFKDIPFVSAVASMCNIGKTIHDWHNLKKLAAFVEQINKSVVDEEKLAKYRAKFETEEKIRNKELTHLLILIDRYIGAERPRLLAKIYLAYLREEISWEELMCYAEVIDRLLPSDYELLASDGVRGVEYKNVNSGYLRLVALGAMVDYGKNSTITMGHIVPMGGARKNYALTEFGAKLAKIVFAD